MSERPTPLGGWSAWRWGSCYGTCATGRRQDATRTCTNTTDTTCVGTRDIQRPCGGCEPGNSDHAGDWGACPAGCNTWYGYADPDGANEPGYKSSCFADYTAATCGSTSSDPTCNLTEAQAVCRANQNRTSTAGVVQMTGCVAVLCIGENNTKCMTRGLSAALDTSTVQTRCYQKLCEHVVKDHVFTRNGVFTATGNGWEAESATAKTRGETAPEEGTFCPDHGSYTTDGGYSAGYNGSCFYGGLNGNPSVGLAYVAADFYGHLEYLNGLYPTDAPWNRTDLDPWDKSIVSQATNGATLAQAKTVCNMDPACKAVWCNKDSVHCVLRWALPTQKNYPTLPHTTPCHVEYDVPKYCSGAATPVEV